MIKLLVIPEAVFDQYKADGVDFSKLLCPNYIASVSSVNDLAEIDAVINEFQFPFCSATPIEKAESPVVGIAIKANSDCDEQFKMQELHNRLEERIATLALRKGNEPPFVGVYYLYPVDENLWVAVQKSLHTNNVDPNRLSLKANHSFFDSMVNELTALPGFKFEQAANTNLFTYYLESQG
ncbi:virion structural protein [Pseudomonas phage PhiPA3]|uniref:Virion structural protein n=1 Tax=Pseudomonas phage PhiPA3 TaxID=998086 RepID=F8SK08_BPPA3|nr:virion structural protein [Pseudomonas phage PhiPA3]AEH03558.1 virion structural protein [Pseudomonas phage PhiPA3]